MGGADEAHAEGLRSPASSRSSAGRTPASPRCINAIMGKKIAITSDTAADHAAPLPRRAHARRLPAHHRSTRQGLHKPHDALGEELQHLGASRRSRTSTWSPCSSTPRSPSGRGDEWVAGCSSPDRASSKKICVLSKTEGLVSTAQQIAAQRAAAEKPWATSDSHRRPARRPAGGATWTPSSRRSCTSCRKGPGVRSRADMETDQPIEVVVAEFVREKILRSVPRRGAPCRSACSVDEMEYDKKKDLRAHLRRRLRGARQPEGHHHR